MLLLGWFVLAEILCPLGSSSSGGPEGDGARAARMGNGGIITFFSRVPVSEVMKIIEQLE